MGRDAEGDGLIRPIVHEFGAHLCFASGMSAYYALVSQFDHALHYDAHNEPFLEDVVGEDWLLADKPTRFWEGRIAAEGETYEAYNEYQIKLIADDELAEEEAKKITFQFRPSVPDARTPDGDRIQAMPEDLPEGIRVQVNSSNVHPDEIHTILRSLAERMDIRSTYFLEHDHHEPSCRVYNAARYVRLDRAVSERCITERDAVLERIARFGSQTRGVGRWEWDNEEIVGHRNTVAMDAEAWSKLLEGRTVGQLLKSYHMKNPEKAPDSATANPKLELQFAQEFSGADWQTVPWSSDGYDKDDLLAELDETLMNALHWAGIRLEPGDPAYVADQYFDPTEGEVRDLTLVEDPTDVLEESEADYATQQFVAADLSDAQEEVFRVISDGGPQHYQEIAEEADVGTSTVYRAVEKVGQLLKRTNGKIAMEDQVIRERVADLWQQVDRAAEWAGREISKFAGDVRFDADSPFARWLERYGISQCELDALDAPVEGYEEGWLEYEINLGNWTRDEVKMILREGGFAAKETHSRLLEQLTNTLVKWRDRDGNRREMVAAARLGSIKVGGAAIR